MPWLALGMALLPIAALAQGVAGGEAEAQKCEERIAAVQRDVVAKYETALHELQSATQKAADLEAALAVRDELRRLAVERSLTEKHVVAEPKALRTLQQQTLSRQQEMVTQLVQETLPRLLELKKALTVAGKLDEAVAVRGTVERLQNNYLPIVRADGLSIVTAEVLLSAYAADRARADKIYKGQRIVVRGLIGGFRTDANDARAYELFLTSGPGAGWVQCSFTPETRFREEKAAFNTQVLVILGKENETSARVQKGQSFELRGVCDGFDESVRLSQCELLR
jgi:hypothetical protein